MAGKITDLTPLAGSGAAAADLIEVVHAGANVSLTLADLAIALALAGIGIYETNVGDGSSVNIVVTHNLNTQYPTVKVRRASAPYDEAIVSNEATSVNTVTLKFGANPPASGQWHVKIAR
jgi:hypothetical protein